jgi:tetratricopeptide (TPR) repeat protein
MRGAGERQRPGAARRLRRRPAVYLACLAVGVLTAGALALAAGTPRGAPASDLQRGQEAYHAGNYDDAARLLGQHLQQNQDETRAWFVRGLAWLRRAEDPAAAAGAQRNYLSLAVADLQQAERLRPDGPTQACLGYAVHRQRELARALYYYAAAIDSGYESAALRNDLACALMEKNQFDKAEQHLARAVHLDARLSAVYHNRGLVNLQRAVMLRLAPCPIKPRPQATVPDAHRLLHEAIDDFARAIDLGAASGELYRDAAFAAAYLAESEHAWMPQTVDYVDRALRHGIHPRTFQVQPFEPMLSGDARFKGLLQRPQPSGPPTPARRLVPILPE